MRILKLCVGAAIVMALVAAGFAHADENAAGTTAAQFLTTGSGPRTLAMGGATLGIGDELGSLSWNVGSLGWMNRTEVMISHAGLENGSSQEWAAVGGRFGQSQTRWSLSGLYQGDGTFEGRDASNNPTGSFGISSIALGAHVAQQFGSMITVGAGAKSVSEKLGDVTGSGFTFDFGLQFKSGIFGFGAAAQNLLGQMKYDGIVYEFPTNYGIGAGLMLPGTGLRLAVDANFPSSYYKDVRMGAEWMWKDMVAVRAGYRTELGSDQDPLTGPTFGLGAGINGMWLDYGYLISDNGDAQHRVGLRLVPGNWGVNGGMPFAQAGSAMPSQDKPKKVAVPKAKPVEQAKVEPAPKKAKPVETEKLAQVNEAPKAQKANEAAKVAPVSEAAVKTTPAPKAIEPAPVKSEPAPAPVTIAPAPAKSDPAKEEPAKDEPRPSKIKVRGGDTLRAIGRRYQVSVAALMMENNLVSEDIQVGQTLKLPQAGR